MPLLDMTDVLTDPDFLDTLICVRAAQSVGLDGMAALTSSSVSFRGVVTSDGGATLKRAAQGERIQQRIRIISKYPLRAGTAGYTADVLTWNGRNYTVVEVDDYSRYGQGFTQATGELISLQG